MYRIDGHPDDEINAASCESIALELWLVDQTDRRDPELLKDQKFYYTTLWHEFLRITKVIMMHQQIGNCEESRVNRSDSITDYESFFGNSIFLGVRSMRISDDRHK